MRAGRVVLPLLLALAACGTTGPKPAAPGGDGAVVPTRDLPEEQREDWAAWKRGGAVWDLRVAAVRADPERARFVVDNLVRVMVQLYGRSRLTTQTGAAPGPFERAQADLVELATFSTPVLVELLRVPDGVVAFLAADRLAAIGASAIAPVAALLTDERDETRRRAAELLARLPHAGDGEVAVETVLGERVARDTSWTVRAEAARALGARGAQHTHKGYALGVLARALRDPDPAVVSSAAVGLSTLGEPTAIPRMADALEAAATAGELKAVQAIEQALASLAGDTRRRSPEEWRRFDPEQARPAPPAPPPGG